MSFQLFSPVRALGEGLPRTIMVRGESGRSKQHPTTPIVSGPPRRVGTALIPGRDLMVSA
jgi:hypothetical protein